MAESFYTLLGVDQGATSKQIRESYRRLARENHPDVNPGDPDAEERFKRVNSAYHVLSDEKRRKDYDEFGDHWARADDIRKAGGGGGFSPRGGRNFVNFADGPTNFGDFGDLGDLFSGYGFSGSAGARRRPQRRRRESQSLDIEISLAEAFKGTKRVVSYRRQESCSVCDGQGYRSSTICANCGGSGATDRPVRVRGHSAAGGS